MDIGCPQLVSGQACHLQLSRHPLDLCCDFLFQLSSIRQVHLIQGHQVWSAVQETVLQKSPVSKDGPSLAPHDTRVSFTQMGQHA